MNDNPLRVTHPPPTERKGQCNCEGSSGKESHDEQGRAIVSEDVCPASFVGIVLRSSNIC